MLRQCIQFALLLLVAAAESQYIGGILQTPSGMGSASDIRGAEIVGDSLSGLGGAPCIWQGENNKFNHLLIDKFDFGQVFGAGGGMQVGYGSINDQWRATMWSGRSDPLWICIHQIFLGVSHTVPMVANRSVPGESIQICSPATRWSGRAALSHLSTCTQVAPISGPKRTPSKAEYKLEWLKMFL